MRIYSRRKFSFIFALIFDDFLMDLLKNKQGEISSFLTGMAFTHPFVRRNDISTAQGKNDGQRYSHHFFTQKDVKMPHFHNIC